MDEQISRGLKLPKTDLQNWNKWNCMTEGITLSVFLFPNDAISNKMEKDILSGVLPHLPGTDVTTITFLCKKVDEDVLIKLGVESCPKAILLKNGKPLKEYIGIIDTEECWKVLVKESSYSNSSR